MLCCAVLQHAVLDLPPSVLSVYLSAARAIRSTLRPLFAEAAWAIGQDISSERQADRPPAKATCTHFFGFA